MDTRPVVLENAVQDGATITNADDTFAVAAAHEETKKRYAGLRMSEGAVVVDAQTIVVKPSVARVQREREHPPTVPPPGSHPPAPARTAPRPARKTPAPKL